MPGREATRERGGLRGEVPDTAAIAARSISRSFGRVDALRDVSLEVGRGEIMALLGHNGAGKTTLVDILTTVLPASRGAATVAGYDVGRQGAEVRRRIGVTGQFTALDGRLSGTANLVLIARLLGAGRRAARDRARELLEMFGLSEAAGRPARTYSGGMRRRLDLAACLIGHPRVVFLDEPTTGLDPSSRLMLWEIVRRLAREGTAFLLTTQYLEEADRLADRITVLSGGRVVASGTAAALKAQIGTHAVQVTLTDPTRHAQALRALRESGLSPHWEPGDALLSTPIASPAEVALVVRTLDAAGVSCARLTVNEPTLDDVYLAFAREVPRERAGGRAAT
ncbi:ATP-binding cassette domain-containing protein [Streptomyces sp. AS02]|uniref:ATP-binding cassette domain-containing protein n=1 Tax=Streptomyces sp. AS02 TaxID=2938946 RepID=UPI0020218E6B|nr:ATP-binding cassette domain-containing protein [Streptomyces sp. AS02]MCL8015961.1 ATP-binding cassette domain-containing protein [Streptomyces sp. AS02]